MGNYLSQSQFVNRSPLRWCSTTIYFSCIHAHVSLWALLCSVGQYSYLFPSCTSCNHHRFIGSRNTLCNHILARIRIIPLQIKRHFLFKRVLSILWEAYIPFLSHFFLTLLCGKVEWREEDNMLRDLPYTLGDQQCLKKCSMQLFCN